MYTSYLIGYCKFLFIQFLRLFLFAFWKTSPISKWKTHDEMFGLLGCQLRHVPGVHSLSTCLHPTYMAWASQVLVLKNPLVNAGDRRDMDSIPESERSPGGGNGNPLQYCCLENPMDRGAWRAPVYEVAKSWTWLKRLSTHTVFMEKRTCGNSYTVSILGLWDWALNPSNSAVWLTLPAMQLLSVRVSMLADREEKSPFYPFDRPLINSNHENWSCA